MTGYNSGCYVNPIRTTSATGPVMIYDSTNYEIMYNTNKTFVIDHPIEKDKYLVHACLEGPESGVYYRGESIIQDGERSVEIKLPEYASKIATNFTVHLTPIYNGEIATICASRVKDNKFTVYGNSCEFNWMVVGRRAPIEVEPRKNSSVLRNVGPYTWIQ
jgi:hypothetical protein